jgi:hypothetical protein
MAGKDKQQRATTSNDHQEPARASKNEQEPAKVWHGRECSRRSELCESRMIQESEYRSRIARRLAFISCIYLSFSVPLRLSVAITRQVESKLECC